MKSFNPLKSTIELLCALLLPVTCLSAPAQSTKARLPGVPRYSISGQLETDQFLRSLSQIFTDIDSEKIKSILPFRFGAGGYFIEGGFSLEPNILKLEQISIGIVSEQTDIYGHRRHKFNGTEKKQAFHVNCNDNVLWLKIAMKRDKINPELFGVQISSRSMVRITSPEGKTEILALNGEQQTCDLVFENLKTSLVGTTAEGAPEFRTTQVKIFVNEDTQELLLLDLSLKN